MINKEFMPFGLSIEVDGVGIVNINTSDEEPVSKVILRLLYLNRDDSIYSEMCVNLTLKQATKLIEDLQTKIKDLS